MNKRFGTSEYGEPSKKMKLTDHEYSSATPSINTQYLWSQLIPQIHDSIKDTSASEPIHRLTKDPDKNKDYKLISHNIKFNQQISDTELFVTLELISRDFTEDSALNIREIFDIIVFITKRTCYIIENFHYRRPSEHWLKQKFAITQARIFSELHIETAEKTKSPDPIKEELKRNTDGSRIQEEEKPFKENQNLIQPRRLLAYMILYIKDSVELSELLFTEDISSDGSNLSVVEKICQTFDQTILQARSKIENLTLNLALAQLLLNLTSHYDEYKDIEAVDRGLKKFFNTILAFSTYDPNIMLCITDSFINIAKNCDRLKLFFGMCIQYASEEHEYSKAFTMYQIPRNECQFQIFFGLMNHVYRFFRDVKDHEIDLLFKLTSNFNALTQLIITNACDMKFLAPSEDPNKRVCKCYSFLVNALFILNEQTIRHRKIHDEDYERQTTFHAKNALILLNSIMKFGGFVVNELAFSVMNEFVFWFTMDDNTVRSKCLQELSKRYPYDQILKRFNEMSKSFQTSYSDVGMDGYELKDESKKNDKKINEFKEELLAELMRDFNI